jgi:hypothetical protein
VCRLDGLFAGNRARAEQRVTEGPGFFTRLARHQAPRVHGRADGLLFGVGARADANPSTNAHHAAALNPLG